ncbi:hypothetical protein C4901_09755 [Acidiferrobacter sp. SPIII_3]|uniref:hypothetical protein n=1 Tax=Acidiferrobacter sp. SPIII_3 TaxID=1281578 RepID=UPI000D7287B5|nr:hypothetical protein [Acidiferrobacter sp. SPIII_3]AWP23575.1 hypothetical protein C4901_09755 [Acidiferrobacter sp. SPIII_3]
MYKILDNKQRRTAINQRRLFTAWEVRQESQRTQGGLSWQRTGNKDSLVRALSRGVIKSLVPRSFDTERTLANFQARKAAIPNRRHLFDERLARQARVYRAFVGVCFENGGAILRALGDMRHDREATTIIGAHTLYAYEGLAGVHFVSDLLTTRTWMCCEMRGTDPFAWHAGGTPKNRLFV